MGNPEVSGKGESGKDIQPQKNRFELALDRLGSGIENFRIIEAKDLDFEFIRSKLTEAGVDLEINENQLSYLKEDKFRSLDKGRGVGAVAMLGKEKAEKLLEWCEENNFGEANLIDPTYDVPHLAHGRGLRQLAADILQLAIEKEEYSKDFCKKTNQRVLKGYRHFHHQLKKVPEIPQPVKTMAAVRPESVLKLWNF